MFHLSKLLNLVAYLIRKTPKMTNKKKNPAPKAAHIKAISYLLLKKKIFLYTLVP